MRSVSGSQMLATCNCKITISFEDSQIYTPVSKRNGLWPPWLFENCWVRKWKWVGWNSCKMLFVHEEGAVPSVWLVPWSPNRETNKTWLSWTMAVMQEVRRSWDSDGENGKWSLFCFLFALRGGIHRIIFEGFHECDGPIWGHWFHMLHRSPPSFIITWHAIERRNKLGKVNHHLLCIFLWFPARQCPDHVPVTYPRIPS